MFNSPCLLGVTIQKFWQERAFAAATLMQDYLGNQLELLATELLVARETTDMEFSCRRMVFGRACISVVFVCLNCKLVRELFA